MLDADEFETKYTLGELGDGPLPGAGVDGCDIPGGGGGVGGWYGA